jgi:hypothetical protein
MIIKHFLAFASWSILVIVAVSLALFFYTFGDCFGDVACQSGKTLSTAFILGGGFIIYWAVAITAFIRWNR